MVLRDIVAQAYLVIILYFILSCVGMQTKTIFTIVATVAAIGMLGMATVAIPSVPQVYADANALKKCLQQHQPPANGGNGGIYTGPQCHEDGSYK